MSIQTYTVTYGISFNQDHAASLGLDWRETYQAMLDELQPEVIRIAAMWSDVEPARGVYDFSDVDWMMDRAAAADAHVLLVVGQKAPRWPECHVPAWVYDVSEEDRANELLEYVNKVVARYKDHEALEYWQVENEAFIRFEFGECELFREELVSQEVDIVRSLDPDRKIVMTDSGELGLWYQPARMADKFGTTLYRIVLAPNDLAISYWWLPPGFYKAKARLLNVWYDDFMVAELQAEPWFNDADPTETPAAMQEVTMDPVRMQQHVNYAARVGASRAYLWGVEWWYFMKMERGDGRYWEVAKQVL